MRYGPADFSETPGAFSSPSSADACYSPNSPCRDYVLWTTPLWPQQAGRIYHTPMSNTDITLQRHLYAYVFKHKELWLSKTPLTLVANERKPAILHRKILATHPSDVVGIMRGRAEYDRPCFASILRTRSWPDFHFSTSHAETPAFHKLFEDTTQKSKGINNRVIIAPFQPSLTLGNATSSRRLTRRPMLHDKVYLSDCDHNNGAREPLRQQR
jgi:hypothetical protein